MTICAESYDSGEAPQGSIVMTGIVPGAKSLREDGGGATSLEAPRLSLSEGQSFTGVGDGFICPFPKCAYLHQKTRYQDKSYMRLIIEPSVFSAAS